MGVKVCFTADLHGNTEHLKRILRCARDQGCDTVVLGGDLGPRGAGWGQPSDGKRIRDVLPHHDDGTIAWDHPDALTYMEEGFVQQRQWLLEEMMPLLEAHSTSVYVMPGNSDWKAHFEPGGALSKHPSVCQARDYSSLGGCTGHYRKVRIVDGEGQTFALSSIDDLNHVPVLGLSLVPISSHKKKDWERRDWRWQEENQIEAGSSLDGFVSTRSGSANVERIRLNTEPRFDCDDDEGSIETALDKVVRGTDELVDEDGNRMIKATIWFVHAPPRHTVGDLTSRGGQCSSQGGDREVRTSCDFSRAHTRERRQTQRKVQARCHDLMHHKTESWSYSPP
jgi:Icc-related predicted phosphoesterase